MWGESGKRRINAANLLPKYHQRVTGKLSFRKLCRWVCCLLITKAIKTDIRLLSDSSICVKSYFPTIFCRTKRRERKQDNNEVYTFFSFGSFGEDWNEGGFHKTITHTYFV